MKHNILLTLLLALTTLVSCSMPDVSLDALPEDCSMQELKGTTWLEYNSAGYSIELYFSADGDNMMEKTTYFVTGGTHSSAITLKHLGGDQYKLLYNDKNGEEMTATFKKVSDKEFTMTRAGGTPSHCYRVDKVIFCKEGDKLTLQDLGYEGGQRRTMLPVTPLVAGIEDSKLAIKAPGTAFVLDVTDENDVKVIKLLITPSANNTSKHRLLPYEDLLGLSLERVVDKMGLNYLTLGEDYVEYAKYDAKDPSHITNLVYCYNFGPSNLTYVTLLFDEELNPDDIKSYLNAKFHYQYSEDGCEYYTSAADLTLSHFMVGFGPRAEAGGKYALMYVLTATDILEDYTQYIGTQLVNVKAKYGNRYQENIYNDFTYITYQISDKNVSELNFWYNSKGEVWEVDAMLKTDAGVVQSLASKYTYMQVNPSYNAHIFVNDHLNPTMQIEYYVDLNMVVYVSLTMDRTGDVNAPDWREVGTIHVGDAFGFYATFKLDVKYEYCTLEADARHDGMYRLKSLFSNGYDFVIDATNPERVVIKEQLTGWTTSGNPISLMTQNVYREVYENRSPEQLLQQNPQFYGRKEGNTIVFGKQSLILRVAKGEDGDKFGLPTMPDTGTILDLTIVQKPTASIKGMAPAVRQKNVMHKDTYNIAAEHIQLLPLQPILP